MTDPRDDVAVGSDRGRRGSDVNREPGAAAPGVSGTGGLMSNRKKPIRMSLLDRLLGREKDDGDDGTCCDLQIEEIDADEN